MTAFRQMGFVLGLFVGGLSAGVGLGMTAVVPTNYVSDFGNAISGIPFLNTSVQRYQQVFNASAFTSFLGPRNLSGVSFRISAWGNTLWNKSTYMEVRLSTTSRSAQNLSSNFADNVGADEKLVYAADSIQMFDESNYGKFTLAIPFQTNFAYRPSAGNLLMEVRIPYPFWVPGYFLDTVTDNVDAISSMYGIYTNTAVGVTNNSGLITRFNLINTNAPELEVSPDGYAFGGKNLHTTNLTTFTVKNASVFTVTATVSGVSSPFAVVSNASVVIPSGKTSNVLIRFAPVASGLFSNRVTFSAGSYSATCPVTGTGTIIVHRIISLGGNLAFGSVVTGRTATAILTITNSGDTALTVSSLSYPPGFSGSWSGSIPAGGSRAVTVTFAPRALQAYGGQMTVYSDKTAGVSLISVSGTGIGRILGLSGSLIFGNVVTGLTATTTLTLTNSGNAGLTVSSISYPPGFSGSWSGSIPAGGKQEVTVTFAPTALQAYGGTMTVASDKTSGGNTIVCGGTGLGRAIGVSGNLSFGNVVTGVAATAQLTITNTGNGTLTVSSIAYPPGFSGVYTGSILPGKSAKVTVTFAPSAMQAYSGKVTVNSDKTSGGNTLVCSGTGIGRVIALQGNLAFGNVVTGLSSTATLTITNSGNAPLAVSSIIYPSGFSGPFSGTLPAGRATNVTVVFAPPAMQAYGGTVTVKSDKSSGGNTLSASGTGIGRVIGVSGDLAFGNVLTGQTATASLIITNSGNAPLAVSSITYPTGFRGPYSGSIPAGQSASVTVTFAPLARQSYGGTVTVNSDRTSGGKTLAASGAGIARVIGVSGDLSFGPVVTGQTGVATLVITNSGNAPLAVSSIGCPAGFSGSWNGSIPAGGSQGVAVTFAPSAMQDYNGIITVYSDMTEGGSTIAVSGSGIGRVLGLSGNLTFGNVVTGQTAWLPLTLTNSGNAGLTITNILSPNGFGASWTGFLASGKSTNVTVAFVPAAMQAYGGTLTVKSDRTSGGDTLSISGTGIGRVIGLSGNLSFGTVTYGQTATSTLTITNSGNAALSVSSISVPEGFSGTWSGLIEPGHAVQVTVTFSPAEIQSYGGLVTVNSDRTSGLDSLTVSGEGGSGLFSLTVASAYGQVSRDLDLAVYSPDTEIRLTVTPDAGFRFSGWSGDASGVSNPLTLRLERSMTVQAGFAPLPPEVLPAAAIGGHAFTARWKWTEGAPPEGEVAVGRDAAFAQLVSGYEARYIMNQSELPVTNLVAGTSYWYRVRRVAAGADPGDWSGRVKVMTGAQMPSFRYLLGDVAVSRSVSQTFAVTNLVSGNALISATSTDSNAVAFTLSPQELSLRYAWDGGTTSAVVRLTLTHTATLNRTSCDVVLRKATGTLAVVGQTPLTANGTKLIQTVTVENRTDSLVYGLRLRVAGLQNPAWLNNKTGLDPAGNGVIRDIPVILPPGAQTTVRLAYAGAYQDQAATQPVVYRAFAIVPPVTGPRPESAELIPRSGVPYDGTWLLGMKANRNRLYMVSRSDDDGATWIESGPALRVTANYLMWMDADEGASSNRLYRVMDAGL